MVPLRSIAEGSDRTREGGMTNRPDIREALRELADELRRRVDIFAVIGREAKITRKGRNGVARCPFHNEKSPSFHVYGGRDAHYHCFGCGAHGDSITFGMHLHGWEFRESLRSLADQGGMLDRFEEIVGMRTPHPAQRKRLAPARDWEAERAREAKRRADFMVGLALQWWRRGVPAVDTLVQIYLQHRIPGYNTPPPSLRFCPAVPETFDPKDPQHKVTWPAMLAGVQGPDRKVRGLHITYLAHNGLGKAPIETTKRMLGVCWGGAVRLSPLMFGKPIVLGEGIETVETVHMRRGFGSATYWATLSLGNLAGAGEPEPPQRPRAHPSKRRVNQNTGEDLGPVWLPTVYPDPNRPGIIIPDAIDEVMILGDGDSDPWITRALVRRATRRFQAQGKRVRQAWAKPGSDFNDMAKAASGEGEDAFGLQPLPDQCVA
jgi:hypothetical protein